MCPPLGFGAEDLVGRIEARTEVCDLLARTGCRRPTPRRPATSPEVMTRWSVCSFALPGPNRYRMSPGPTSPW